MGEKKSTLFLALKEKALQFVQFLSLPQFQNIIKVTNSFYSSNSFQKIFKRYIFQIKNYDWVVVLNWTKVRLLMRTPHPSRLRSFWWAFKFLEQNNVIKKRDNF